ncbi:hypothetical protein pb186bvf_015845 [Paramecium bursaria]
MFIIRLFHHNPLDMCISKEYWNKIFCSFHDNWVYIVLAIHYRFFVICQLKEDRFLQFLQLSQHKGENNDDSKEPNSFCIKDKYFTLDITNNTRLNKLICNIFLDEWICLVIIIIIIIINAIVQFYLNSVLLDEVEDIITQLLFLHVLYLQGKLIYEFQQKIQLILLLILRDIIESMDIVSYRRVYICYILIFLIQAWGPLLWSFKIRKFHLVDPTDLQNLPQGEGMQIEIFEKFKLERQSGSIEHFKQTVSYATLNQIASVNHKVKDTLCNFGLF